MRAAAILKSKGQVFHTQGTANTKSLAFNMFTDRCRLRSQKVKHELIETHSEGGFASSYIKF